MLSAIGTYFSTVGVGRVENERYGAGFGKRVYTGFEKKENQRTFKINIPPGL